MSTDKNSINLTGNQFLLTNPEGTNLFSLGSVSLQTNNLDTEKENFEGVLGAFSNNLNIDNVKNNDLKNKFATNNITAFLNIDRTNLRSYAYFGSLRISFSIAVKRIITEWPASLYINSQNTGISRITAKNVVHDASLNETTFNIPVFQIENNFGVNYYEDSSNNRRNLVKNFEEYEVSINNSTYKLTDFEKSPSEDNGFITLTVQGNPFPNVTSTKENFHIKPNNNVFTNFQNCLSNLESYLLNTNSTPLYTATFKVSRQSNSGTEILERISLTWPTSDGYNIDINENSLDFRSYITNLFALGNELDEEKTDIINRQLITNSLSEFDTDDARFQNLIQIYGNSFDSLKVFIDGISNANRVTYNKKENIPDVFIKKLAKTLGYGIINTQNTNDLTDLFLGSEDSTDTSSIPQEVDIEFWRRLVINTSWLVKGKGTRKVLEFLFEFIGAPDCLISFNEHVYLVDKQISPTSAQLLIEQSAEPERLPIDENGFPKILTNTTDHYFQNKGGWYEQVRTITPDKEPIGFHRGDYDRGQAYFDVYREDRNILNFSDDGSTAAVFVVDGYNLNRTIDNRKSWLSSPPTGDTRKDIVYDTSYTTKNEKLILNTKEVSFDLDIPKAIECDIYQCNQQFGHPIKLTGYTDPRLPDTELTRLDVNNLTFPEYINKTLRFFVDAKHRKIIDDAHGGGYPTLTLLYKLYLDSQDCNSLDYNDIKNYVKNFDNFWLDLLAQFIPATTIVIGSGERWANIVHHPQKYVYKRGINDGSEFQQTVKVDPDLPNLKLNLLSVKGTINKSITGRLGTLSFGINDIFFGYPCIGGNNEFYEYTRNQENNKLRVNIGNWSATYDSSFGEECPTCDTFYTECAYTEDGYWECDCVILPDDPCTMDYVDCGYVEIDYVE